MDSRRNSQTHDGDAATRWESSHDYPSHSSGRRLIFPRDIEPLQVEDCIRRKEAFSHAVTRARWRCVRDGHKTNKDAPSLLYNRLSLDPVHSNHKLRPFSTKNQSRGDPTKKKKPQIRTYILRSTTPDSPIRSQKLSSANELQFQARRSYAASKQNLVPDLRSFTRPVQFRS